MNLTFPVVVRNQAPNTWKPMSWVLVKELRKTIMQYGLASPFTRGLLQTAVEGELMTPFDMLALADLIFTPTQKALFRVH